MRGSSPLDEIVAAFAEAVAAGEFQQAEGWFSAARATAQRELQARS